MQLMSLQRHRSWMIPIAAKSCLCLYSINFLTFRDLCFATCIRRVCYQNSIRTELIIDLGKGWKNFSHMILHEIQLKTQQMATELRHRKPAPNDGVDLGNDAQEAQYILRQYVKRRRSESPRSPRVCLRASCQSFLTNQ